LLNPIEDDEIIKSMLQAARLAAREAIAIRKDAKLNAVQKSDSTWLTDADHAAQRIIHQTLEQAPVADVKFIGEEAPPEILAQWLNTNKAGKAWVVDPIDGTFAFKRDSGQPWSVSIALQENGVTTHAVLYEATGDDRDPTQLKGKFYVAVKGQGAKVSGYQNEALNFQPLKAPRAPDKTICVGLFNKDNIDGKADKGASHNALIQHFKDKDFGINHTYCATVGMLATTDGRMAGYIHGQHMPWDSAAATLVMQEAGCKIAEVPDSVNPAHSIVISSPSQQLLTDLGNALRHTSINHTLSGNVVGNRL